MIRILLTYVLPLVLPTLIYVLWVQWKRRSNPDAEIEVEWPWFWLLVAGFVLLLASLGTLSVMHSGGTEGEYHAPILKDGKVVPGHYDR